MTTSAETPTAAVALKSRHLLGIAGLDADEITLILDTAEAMKEIGGRAIKKVPTLRGRTVVNLFFEPSTRTSISLTPGALPPANAGVVYLAAVVLPPMMPATCVP